MTVMSIDSRTLRQTVGRFVTGVTVIAIDVEGEIRAMTANSFTSLSLDPPLVLFCLGKDTKAGRHIHSAPGFSVSILREDQRDLSSYFAGGWAPDAIPPPFSLHRVGRRSAARRLHGRSWMPHSRHP